MIREGIDKVLKEILNVEEIPFNIPPQRELGDLSSAVCLSIAKQRRESPLKIAQEVAERLKSKLPPYVSSRIPQFQGGLADIGSRPHPPHLPGR